MSLKIFHQLLAFSLEIAMLIAIGYWGFQQGKTTLIRYSLMLLALTIVIVLWGIFAAPKSQFRLDLGLRLIFIGILFALTTLSLYQTEHPKLAACFGISAFASMVMSYLFKD